MPGERAGEEEPVAEREGGVFKEKKHGDSDAIAGHEAQVVIVIWLSYTDDCQLSKLSVSGDSNSRAHAVEQNTIWIGR